MEDILYRLANTKITLEYKQLIDLKQCQLTFNDPKFHIISHFI